MAPGNHGMHYDSIRETHITPQVCGLDSRIHVNLILITLTLPVGRDVSHMYRANHARMMTHPYDDTSSKIRCGVL